MRKIFCIFLLFGSFSLYGARLDLVNFGSRFLVPVALRSSQQTLQVCKSEQCAGAPKDAHQNSSKMSACSMPATYPPDFLSFAIGAYDFYRPKHRTCEFEIEYKFHVKWMKPPNRYLQFRPLIGAMATAKGSFYAYIGINFDLLFFDHLLFAPGFAGGYYASGGGKNLGYPIEFRSGVELAWQFCDWHRIGFHFYHLSNASLGRRNPGEESLVLFYDIPLIKGFPFIRDN